MGLKEEIAHLQTQVNQLKNEIQNFSKNVVDNVNKGHQAISEEVDNGFKEEYDDFLDKIADIQDGCNLISNKHILSNKNKTIIDNIMAESQNCYMELDNKYAVWDSFSRIAWHKKIKLLETHIDTIKTNFETKINNQNANYLSIMALLIALVSIIFANVVNKETTLKVVLLSNLSILSAITLVFIFVKYVLNSSIIEEKRKSKFLPISIILLLLLLISLVCIAIFMK